MYIHRMNTIPVRQLRDSFFEERFSLRSIEPLVAERALIHDLHRHDFYFILFVEKGKGEHEIDFIHYEVGEFSVFFLRPGQVHQLKLAQGASGFMLQFTSQFYSPKDIPAIQVLRKVSTKNHCRLSSEEFAHIMTLLQLIFTEFSRKQDRYKDVIRAYLAILFIELARQSPHSEKTGHKASPFAQERLEELQDMLEKNIHTKKQVSDYAEMLAMTPYQLNSITKTSLHKTCSEVINEHIILEAKRLLLATANRINQVADLLGYDDPSYFIRFFKKQTGYTPDAFRQNFK